MSGVWTKQWRSPDKPVSEEARLNVVVEQWKLLVDTTERVSTRRSLTNTFFLGINAAVFTLLAAFWTKGPVSWGAVPLVFPLVAVLVSCLVWLALLQSYRRLNQAKFQIVHELERQLPAAVFGEEWRLLNGGSRLRRYRRLSYLEQLVPVVFMTMYVIAYVVALTAD